MLTTAAKTDAARPRKRAAITTGISWMISRFDGLIVPRSAAFTPVAAPIRRRASAASETEGLGSCRAIGIGSRSRGSTRWSAIPPVSRMTR